MENALIDLIPTLGFPIVCVIAMALFIVYMVKSNNEENKTIMESLQERCKEREDKLFEEIAENRKINGKFAEIISKHEEKLDSIQQDVKDIKTDITILKAHND